MAVVNRDARVELTRAVSDRYRGSTKDEKTMVLNEFVRLTGYLRQHALRVLRRRAPDQTPAGAGRRRIYDEAVRPRNGSTSVPRTRSGYAGNSKPCSTRPGGALLERAKPQGRSEEDHDACMVGRA